MHSELAEDLWELVRPYLGVDKGEIACEIIDLFEAAGCEDIEAAERLCKDAGREYLEEEEEE